MTSKKFIQVTDKELSREMIDKGMKVVMGNDKCILFVNEVSNKFSFENIDSSKYVYTNTITF